MSVVAWAALASGLLTGKYTRGANGIAGATVIGYP
jgi:aryl-alcohol dehydrogenase-like predicted oxidoreductase